MSHLTTLIRTLGAAACVATLAACGSAPVAAPVPRLHDMLSQAAQAAGSGEKEKAVTLWRQAAAIYPTDKAPWTQIAQTRFESGHYGEAIVSAQEVLVRDPNDKLAGGIIAISGLRLSTRAIADLSRQNNLTGPVRTESHDLARLLRESLGETVLVPPGAPKGQPGDRRGAGPKKLTKAGESDARSDPFGALR